jgi:uncharacterized protein YuzE
MSTTKPKQIQAVLEHDKVAKAAYLRLGYWPDGAEGIVARSVPVDAEGIVLDFDHNGSLIGVEFLAESAMPKWIVA